MELNDRLSTLTKVGQQSKIMERVFQKLLLAFGNQMQAKWHGIDMHAVYEDWAETLQNCSLGSINFAISQSKLDTFPPSQGSFLAYCQQYKPPLIEKRLEKLHVKDCEYGLARIADIKKQLADKMRIEHDPGN